MGDLTLLKAKGVEKLDLRKGIQIERRKQINEQSVVIQHNSDNEIPFMVKNKNNPLLESLNVESIKSHLGINSENTQVEVFNNLDSLQSNTLINSNLKMIETNQKWICSNKFERWIILEG